MAPLGALACNAEVVTDDELLELMLPVLEIDLQYHAVFDVDEPEAIAQARRVGRKAVRRLGHKAVTSQSDPAKGDDGRVAVWVVADIGEGPDLDRLADRANLLICGPS